MATRPFQFSLEPLCQGECGSQKKTGTPVATLNTGYPAVVVRAGSTAEGMPIGVQVVARPWRDDVALAVAAIIEDAMGGWQPPNCPVDHN